MKTLTIIYLVFMFIALYMFFFYIILIFRNRKVIFDYPKAKKKYFISVLIPAYNEENTIEDTIKAIEDSNYDKKFLEVIAINNGSKDVTKEKIKKLLKKYRNLKLLDLKKNLGKGGGLNKAIKIAKGELVVVTDSDSFPGKDSIKKLTGYFDDENVGAVTSCVFVRNRKTWFGKIQAIEYVILAWTRKLLDFIDAVYVTNGPLSMYRKSYLKKVGGFDTNTVTEDIELTWHMLYEGYSTKMCLDADVSTEVPLKFKRWMRQRVRWGLGGFQAIWKYKRAFLRKGMLGFFVIPFVSMSILLSMGVFLFGLYILLKKFLSVYLVTGYSFLANTYLFRFEDVNLAFPVVIYFTVILFITSYIYSTFILHTMSSKKGEHGSWDEFRNIFNRLFYLLLYLTLYPIVWFIAIYRLIRKDFTW